MLILCPSCSRHVRTNESSCPFCDGALGPQTVQPRRAPLGRIALFVGASMALAGGACATRYGMPPAPPPQPDQSGQEQPDDGYEEGAQKEAAER